VATNPTLLRAVDRLDQLEQRAVHALDRAGVLGPAPAAAAPPRVPPGPPPRRGRLLGSIAYYLRFALDPIRVIRDRFEAYGDLYYAPSADGGLYAIRHPDHLQEVLVTRAADYVKAHTALVRLEQVLGQGLLTSDGDAWRRHRRMIQPAFHQARLAGYAAAIVDEAERAAGQMRDGEEQDMAAEMMELTLRAVSRALFSHDVGGETAAFAQAMTALQETLAAPDFAPKWLPTPGRRRIGRAVADLDRITGELVAARRAAAPPDPPDLLQALVDAADEEGDGARLTGTQVRDELVTLFLAGHETTANVLAWTLYLLSQHPDAEARLHAEVDATIGDRPPALADLARMPWGEQVIKEAMRLYPPVFMVARRARADTEIGGYPVPRGSEVVVWIYMTHHDARWFPEPERFRPERFAPEEEARLPRLAYAPFGAGPRICIGKGFAMMEARLILAALARRHRFALGAGQEIAMQPRITLRPRNGLRMRVIARNAAL
jgi:cytochrome P450